MILNENHGIASQIYESFFELIFKMYFSPRKQLMSALLEIEMIVIGVRGNRALAKLQLRVSFL